MKILINDKTDEWRQYEHLFKGYGYDKNELLFFNDVSDVKLFIQSQLETQQNHIDLIITGEDADSGRSDELRAAELLWTKNAAAGSFSGRNFRVNSIPVLLYTHNGDRRQPFHGFEAVVHKNTAGQHDFFIQKMESLIRDWRTRVFADLETLQLKPANLGFRLDPQAFERYQKHIRFKEDALFDCWTTVLSREFIRAPAALRYEWVTCSFDDIATPYDKFRKTLYHHLKYNTKITERTVWHTLFKQYPKILLRDIFEDFLYEHNLFDNSGQESEECDFILRTAFPERLRTTFFEVKREDKKYYTRTKHKRPQFRADFTSDLLQLWQYKKFAEDPKNTFELVRKIGYQTRHFDYVLLAGREEERLQMASRMDEQLSDHYPGIEVRSFESHSNDYLKYIAKFDRLSVG